MHCRFLEELDLHKFYWGLLSVPTVISLVYNKKIVARPLFEETQCEVPCGPLTVSLVVPMSSTDDVHPTLVKSTPRLRA